MIKPKATLTVSHQKILFRFDKLPHSEFDNLIRTFKQDFPERRWDAKTETWELPIERLQAVYEFCRGAIGPKNVKISFAHYTLNNNPQQLTLFN